jgi:hypothetical protein
MRGRYDGLTEPYIPMLVYDDYSACRMPRTFSDHGITSRSTAVGPRRRAGHRLSGDAQEGAYYL